MLARVLLIVALGAAPAFAQPRQQEAAAHFARGEAAQAEGRYRDAIAEYEQAHALVPHPNTLYNIAVCYEGLDEWATAADHYQKYLDAIGPTASDADAVRAKIRELRARLAPVPPVDPDPDPDPPRQPLPLPTGDQLPPPPPVTPARWHAGISGGFGFGDTPVHRYAAFGGMRLAQRLDLDAVLGAFGRNDRGLGVAARFTMTRMQPQPFIRAQVTIGYAKQDASSIAETRFPLGVEAGGGVALGRRGRVELGLAVRWLAGGWDAASTTADSFVNDELAFAIDLGVALDLPVKVNAH